MRMRYSLRHILVFLCFICLLAFVRNEYICQLMPNITLVSMIIFKRISLQNTGVLGEPIDKRQYGGNGLKFVVIYAESIRRHRLFNDFKVRVFTVVHFFFHLSIILLNEPCEALFVSSLCGYVANALNNMSINLLV
ncbi:unnamed protein product [Schistosoma guineensis]|nr:unnamed protein product [Schistosoma guineensis]